LITSKGCVEVSLRGAKAAEVFCLPPGDVWLAGSDADEELLFDDVILSWEVLVGDAVEFVVVLFGVWAVELVRGRVALAVLVAGRV